MEGSSSACLNTSSTTSSCNSFFYYLFHHLFHYSLRYQSYYPIRDFIVIESELTPELSSVPSATRKVKVDDDDDDALWGVFPWI